MRTVRAKPSGGEGKSRRMCTWPMEVRATLRQGRGEANAAVRGSLSTEHPGARRADILPCTMLPLATSRAVLAERRLRLQRLLGTTPALLASGKPRARNYAAHQ